VAVGENTGRRREVGLLQPIYNTAHDRLGACEVERETQRGGLVVADALLSSWENRTSSLVEDECAPVGYSLAISRLAVHDTNLGRDGRHHEDEVLAGPPVLEACDVADVRGTTGVAHRIVDVVELSEGKARFVAVDNEHLEGVGRVAVLSGVASEEEVVLEPLNHGSRVAVELWGARDLGLGLAFGAVLHELAVGCADDKLLALDGPAAGRERPIERGRGTAILNIDENEPFAREENRVAPQVIGGRCCGVGQDIEKGVGDALFDSRVRGGLESAEL
jgi:hypothetical protein